MMRRLAAQRLAKENSGQTLELHGLVHEAIPAMACLTELAFCKQSLSFFGGSVEVTNGRMATFLICLSRNGIAI
jgi:hypothetical protein